MRKQHNPTWVKQRDAAEQVQMAADYEYEFDEHGNWTKRSVRTWTRESGERKLQEIDSRRSPTGSNDRLLICSQIPNSTPTNAVDKGHDRAAGVRQAIEDGRNRQQDRASSQAFP
jgi:hypothetical protein